MFLGYPLRLHRVGYWRDKKAFAREVEQAHCWLLIAVESGSFVYRIQGHEGVAVAGDIVICPPRLDFNRKMLPPLSFYYIRFSFNNEVFGADEERAYSEHLEKLYGYKFTSAEPERMSSNYRYILRASRMESPETNRYAVHHINDIWLMLSRETEQSLQTGEWAADPAMKCAKEWIEEHVFGELHLKHIAQALDLHPVQFTRRFQSVFGMPPSQYALSLRMDKAKGLLLQTDYTMDHIAQLCGYDNGLYFSRIFTKYAGVNPSVYRKQHRLSAP